MKILVVGSGAREHALVWRCLQSPAVSDVYCAPGNGGTGMICRNVELAVTDQIGLTAFARQQGIDLVIIGPETPLIAGLADTLRQAGLDVFGPSAAGARLEGSKAWAKSLMFKYSLPCAQSESFDSFEAARDYALAGSFPLVVKADGEAAGKGVVIATDAAQAEATLRELMVECRLGESGKRVVLEEFLTGMEVSAMAFCDGERIVPMTPACDYKRVYDGDAGPNTGGMGAYSPPSAVNELLMQQITETILEPTLAALQSEGIDYRGVVYAGLMLTADGPKLLEFNARFGDPETQVVLPRLQTDFVSVARAVARGHLDEVELVWDSGAACGVVLTAAGYPGKYSTGAPISGLDRLDAGVLAFHAGTRQQNGRLLTNGGRVLTVVAKGSSVSEARQAVYRNLERIDFGGKTYRSDIAAREEDR